MAADSDPASTHKIVRITEEELERSIESVKDIKNDGQNEPKRYSKSRADVGELMEVTPDRPNSSAKGKQKDDFETTAHDESEKSTHPVNGLECGKNEKAENSATKPSMEDAVKSSDDSKGRSRRVKQGFQLYTVKRGKYSEKISIKENDFSKSEKDKIDRDKTKGARRDATQKGFDLNDKRSSRPVNSKGFAKFNKDIDSRLDSTVAPKQSENWDDDGTNSADYNNSSNAVKDISVEEDWDGEATFNDVTRVNIDKEVKPEYQEVKVESITVENNKSVSNDSPAIKDGVKEPEIKKKDASKEKKLNVEKSKDGSRKSSQSTEDGPSLQITDRIIEDKTEKSAKSKKLQSPKEEKPGRSAGRGIGRGKRNKNVSTESSSVGMKGQTKKSDVRGTSLRHDVSKKEKNQDSELFAKTEIEPEPQGAVSVSENSKEGIDSTNTKRKVTFSDDQAKGNENVTENDLPSEKNSRSAGILVLPSPISETQRASDDQPFKPSPAKPEKESGFEKLKRPNSFDPKKPRGDARFIKDGTSDKNSLLVKKKDLMISSKDTTVWNRIKTECNKIRKLLSGSLSSLDDFEKILDVSTLLQDLYKELIVKHLEFSFKNDVEGSLWKNTFHNIITAFRLFLDQHQDTSLVNDIFQFYWNFLQDGDDFLQDLLLSLQEEYKFDLNSFLSNPLKMAGCKKQVKFSIRSCHFILLNLGDLERYITDLQHDTNYDKATDNYLKAQKLAPKNGKSYNQLAIVAVKSKKKLNAIYYYIRSLEASNPIESARERLTGIFHEIKRKADLTKKQSLEKSLSFANAAKQAQLASEEKDDFKSDYSREDVWVFFHGGKCFKAKILPNGKIQELKDGSNEQSEEDHPTEKVSLGEANKEFLVYYLHMHGKLYSRIGFEYIHTVYEDAMQPFKVLLKHPKASSVRKDNLIKYMALNIFAIDNLFCKQERKMQVIKDSPLDVAIIFGMDMSARIAEHCSCLIERAEMAALNQFLPAIHVWMKWMVGYLALIKTSSVCYMRDIWESYVTFLNGIRSLKVDKVDKIEDGEPVGLYEDIFLSGFKPLMDMENPTAIVPIDQVEKAETYLRTESLKDLAFMISDSEKLPVVFDDEILSFKVSLPEATFDSPTKHKNTLHIGEPASFEEDVGSDVIIEDVIEDIDDRELQELKALKAKKMELTAQVNDQEKREQERAAIMESNASQAHIISENHPKFIVADTNCFIDDFEGLQRIIDTKDFNVIVPLIVVNELDGLKKGKDMHGSNNAAYVKERACQAVQMLETRFSENDKQIRALTSAGTELETITFRDEELSSDKGKNDDIILSCCLHYCEESTNRFSSGGGPLLVQRNVVLLTDDRNLRLKAHSRHVPTLSMKMFLKMAHIV